MRTNTGILGRAGLLLLALFTIAGIAYAGVPNPPFGLGVTQLGTNGAYLVWAGDSMNTENITEYRVYQATGTLQQHGAFAQVNGIFNTDSIRSGFVSYIVSGLAPGSYVFYVTAVNNDGESQPSSKVEFTLSAPRPYIEVTSFPQNPDYAQVDVEYVVDIDAVASDGRALTYEIGFSSDSTNSPIPGITIDPNTGVLRFTPTQVGNAFVAVRIKGAGTPLLEMQRSWQIIVRNCARNSATTIFGRVTDQNGDPIVSGSVIAMQIDPVTGKTIDQAWGQIGQSGYYFIRVDQGTHILKAEGTNFVSEWYQDAYVESDAEAVEIECGDSAIAHFSVTSRTTPQNVVVMGNASIASTGESVNAVIQFTGFENGVPASAQWERKIVIWAFTNDSLGQPGAYEVFLPNNYTYIAYAYATDEYGRLAIDSLSPLYYDNVTSAAAATSISLGSTGVSGIDFAFPTRVSYDNGFEGKVKHAQGNQSATVIAYQLSDFGRADEIAYTTQTESNGDYAFTNLVPGDYVVLAIPTSSNYAPGYYVDGEFAALSWRDATVISVPASGSVAGNHDIKLRNSNANGGGRMQGTVSGNPGKSLKLDEGGSLLGALPVAGAMVVALDANNEVIGYTFSRHDGSFDLNGVPAGSHRVIVDKVGFDKHTSTQSFTDGQVVTGDILLQGVTSSVPNVPGISTGALSAFPNPASSSVTLRFTGSHGTSRMSITTTTGVEVASRGIETVEGTNVLPVDLAGLASGMYIVKIQSGSATMHLPITIAR